MRFKAHIVVLLIVVLIGVTICALPATAASGSKAGNGGYTVKFVKQDPNAIRPMTVYGSISQGQYQWQSRLINYYTTSVNFCLWWGNPSNSLRLRIFTPDGYVLGPFYDSYDGGIDGAIGVQVYRSGGVAQGTWYTEVYGDRVSGSQSYCI